MHQISACLSFIQRPARLLAATLAISLLLPNGQLSAATAPYFETFNDDATGATLPSEPSPESGIFASSNEGAFATYGWSVVNNTGGRAYRQFLNVASGATSSFNLSSTLSFSNLAASNFVQSTSFTLNNLAETGGDGELNLGLGALGSLGHFNSGIRYELRYILNAFATPTNPLGSLRLEEIGGDGQINATSIVTVPVQIGIPYTLTLSGSYSAGTLSLTGALSSSGGSATVTDSDNTPLTGTNYGYLTNHVRSAGFNSTIDVNFDDYSMTVPEPCSTALILGGIATTLGRRRRRK